MSVLCGGRLVGEHERCWARHQSITDTAHRAAADALRSAHHDTRCVPVEEQVERRSLADYDAAFGLACDADIDGAVA